MDACPDCGAPYELKRKFNGGNPMDILFPTCDCADKKFDQQTDDFIDRLHARKPTEEEERETMRKDSEWAMLRDDDARWAEESKKRGWDW